MTIQTVISGNTLTSRNGCEQCLHVVYIISCPLICGSTGSTVLVELFAQ